MICRITFPSLKCVILSMHCYNILKSCIWQNCSAICSFPCNASNPTPHLSTLENPNKEDQKTAKMSAPSRPTFPNLLDFCVSRISHSFGTLCFLFFPAICTFYYRAPSQHSCFLSTGQNPSIRIRKPLVLHAFLHYRTLTFPHAASKDMAQRLSSPQSTQ